MNNKFALSFGISLMIVGILNIFFETNNVILFGLSTSTIIFSIINMFVPKIKNGKSELLYIIPFVFLTSIFCYSNSLVKNDLILKIINSNITNVLTFLSFGFLFISEYFNYKKSEKQYVANQMEMILDNLEYSALILEIQTEYLRILTKDSKSDEIQINEFYKKLEKLCTEKIKLSKIDLELLSEKIKGPISIQQFNKIYQKYNDSLDIYGHIDKYNNSKMKKDNNKNISRKN